ncbi:unnamed protein product [Tuber aestivum]|uniref:Uncharacterized protein n=1 Tax=Tuber aestivum TaxID=59557 RepID=A0A292PVY5_9PEZI|nr:unnamed protein product [Tuber aestivum]
MQHLLEEAPILMMIPGEVQDPRRNTSTATKKDYIHIRFPHYLVGVLYAGIICSSNGPTLLPTLDGGKAGSDASTRAIGIERMGINFRGWAYLINPTVMTSTSPCVNA